MICVNFKLSKFHAEGSSYILRAGRGKLRHNCNAFNATQRWFLPRCLCATLHHMENSGKQILSGLLYNKVMKKSQNIRAFPVNSGLLETAEHLCRAHQCRQPRSSLPAPWQSLWHRSSSFTCSLGLHTEGKYISGVCRTFVVWAYMEGGHAPPQPTHHLRVPAHGERLLSLRSLWDTPAWRGTERNSKARQT